MLFCRFGNNFAVGKGSEQARRQIQTVRQPQEVGDEIRFLSSKCTCMSTMRVLEEACAGWSDAALGERVSAEF